MKTTFWNIAPGDAFYYDGVLYIRTEAIVVFGQWGSFNYNCIVADTGAHEWFNDYEEVEPVNLGIRTRKYE